MIQPLLHLLQRGSLDRPARIRAVASLAGGHNCHNGIGLAGGIHVLASGDAVVPVIDLAEIRRDYPELAHLQPRRQDDPTRQNSPKLLVVVQAGAGATPAILAAMAEGRLVLVPDDGPGMGLVRDGVNGFHYRARDPDSLALALLTLKWLPADLIGGILERARATFSTQLTDVTSHPAASTP